MSHAMIPYARPWVDQADLEAVAAVLRSPWLTTGPRVQAFEEAVAGWVGAGEAVALSSGTAALHAAMAALGVEPGDEVIVPPLTFAATANCVVYQGGTPVFADIDPETLLLDPAEVEKNLTPRTRGVIAVDYAGQPCDYDALKEIARRHGLFLVADACHALGATYRGRHVGTLADLTVFSFHPVKHITTGEGGMVVTQDPELAARVRRFRHHGLDADHLERGARDTWEYDMVDLGYNYRLSDLHCALGLSQLRRLPDFLARRREIARRYDRAFAGLPGLSLPRVRPEVSHAYHLYVILLNLEWLHLDREEIFRELRAAGLGVNVHYRPVYLHSFYRRRFHLPVGLCPRAEAVYARLLTLPLYPAMTAMEVERVVAVVTEVLEQGTVRRRHRHYFP
jgi:perosamine synthetase